MISPEQRKAAFRSGRFAMDKDSVQSVGLIGWWPLGVHGGKADDLDYSGFGNHGTRSSSGLSQLAMNHSRFGSVNALHFNGAAGELAIDGSAFEFGFTNFSVSISVFVDVWGTSDRIVHHRQPGEPKIGWDLLEIAGEGFRFISDFGVSIPFIDTNMGLLTGTWYNILVTINRSGSFNIYTDSVLRGSLDITAHSAKDLSSGTDLEIGHLNSASNRFDGKIKDARIYNRAQPADMVFQIYNEPWRLVYPLGLKVMG